MEEAAGLRQLPGHSQAARHTADGSWRGSRGGGVFTVYVLCYSCKDFLDLTENDSNGFRADGTGWLPQSWVSD